MEDLDALVKKARKGYKNLTNDELIKLYMELIKLDKEKLRNRFGPGGMSVVPNIINEAKKRGITLKR